MALGGVPFISSSAARSMSTNPLVDWGSTEGEGWRYLGWNLFLGDGGSVVALGDRVQNSRDWVNG